MAESLRLVLEELEPKNVDTSAVTVTGEGDEIGIVIVPHRDLGGISLVLLSDKVGTQLLWAGIGDMSSHDDIDLGVVVARIPHEGNWPERLRDAIALEFGRPIRLKHRRRRLGGPKVDCFVTGPDKEMRLAVLSPQFDRRGDRRGPVDVAITSLNGGAPLSFSVPPPIEKWRRNS